MAKILRLIINIIFVIVIGLLLLYVILRFTNNVLIYNVETGSMENNIHAGDYILIFKKGDYNIGDIVTYRKDNYFITHRIIKKDGNTFITKGDANNVPDEMIDFNDIMGKVLISGGILNIVITYKYVFVSLFLGLYLLSCYIRSRENENKKYQENS